MKTLSTVTDFKEHKETSDNKVTSLNNSENDLIKSGYIKNFIEHNYRHFNALILREAAREWEKQIENGNYMMLTMAGAMSTAEIGTLLAEISFVVPAQILKKIFSTLLETKITELSPIGVISRQKTSKKYLTKTILGSQIPVSLIK